MRFLVDAQLPPALARWLASHGHVAEHVADVNMVASPDSEIWSYSARVGATIMTKDEDFAVWRYTGQETDPAVVWLRIGNTRRAELLQWMSPLLPRITEALQRGELLIEVSHAPGQRSSPTVRNHH